MREKTESTEQRVWPLKCLLREKRVESEVKMGSFKGEGPCGSLVCD